MKTSLASLLAASCMATLLIAAEPNATTAPVPATLPNQPGNAPAPGASPSASPAHYHRHHVLAAASPSPTAKPAKHKWWQRKPVAKATPSASPTATPRRKPAPTPSPAPSRPSTLSTPSTTASPSPSASPSPAPKRAKSKPWWSFFNHHPKKAHEHPSPSPSATPEVRPRYPKTGAAWQPSASPAGIPEKKQEEPGKSGTTPKPAHQNQPAATPQSTPKATPRPTPVATPTPAPEATPMAEATPASKRKHQSNGMTSQVPFVPGGSQEQPMVETKSPFEIEAEEASHFKAAKAKALQDQHVQELQAKADSATGDDAKAASRRYYKALYNKMREIDPAIKDRIDRTEAATLRRVEQESPL